MMKPNDDSSTLRGRFGSLQPLYRRLVDEITHVLETKIRLEDISVVAISGRVKTLDSLISKISRKEYINPLDDITDLAGARVVCGYETDVLKIAEVIKKNIEIHEHVDKSHELDVDKMGYHGEHFIVVLGDRFAGVRYEGITGLKCEIQVRTVLQDAWAMISRQLVYTAEETIPKRLQRDFNNVASLLEIAQGIFDSVREKRNAYVDEIQKMEKHPTEFLSQPVDFETLTAYTRWKFPNLQPSEGLTLVLLEDLNPARFPTLGHIDVVVERARPAIEVYQKENPKVFKWGTDFITKSLGFADIGFRRRHGFGTETQEAFSMHGRLIKLK